MMDVAITSNMASSTDDIFDEDVDDSDIGSRDFIKSQASIIKDGYREGLAEGKESSLQTGFNTGFLAAYNSVNQVSKLRGKICATLSLHHICGTQIDPEVEQKLQEMLLEARQLEKKYADLDIQCAKYFLDSQLEAKGAERDNEKGDNVSGKHGVQDTPLSYSADNNSGHEQKQESSENVSKNSIEKDRIEIKDKNIMDNIPEVPMQFNPILQNLNEQFEKLTMEFAELNTQ